MNSRLIGRGFLNSLNQKGAHLFADVAIQNGRKYRVFSVLVDKHFSEELLSNASVDQILSVFSKKPVVLCILNPDASIRDGEVVWTGVLSMFVDFEIYKSGLHNKEILGEV